MEDITADTLFEEYDIVYSKVSTCFRGFEHEINDRDVSRNLLGVFNEEYERYNNERIERERHAINKNNLVHTLQKSFALRLNEVTRCNPVQENHQSKNRIRLPKPPSTKEGPSHREKRLHRAQRKDHSLNILDDSSMNPRGKLTKSVDHKDSQTGDKSKTGKMNFNEFMSKVKDRSVVQYLKDKQRRNYSYKDQPLFNTHKYEHDHKYQKLKNYISNNYDTFSHKMTMNSYRSVDRPSYINIKNARNTLDRKDPSCEDPPKTASTNLPSSTSRLKHIVSHREKTTRTIPEALPDAHPSSSVSYARMARPNNLTHTSCMNIHADNLIYLPKDIIKKIKLMTDRIKTNSNSRRL